MSIEYPLKPKSTSYLEQGQFWAVPLEQGGFGCGVVLAKLLRQGKTDTRLFFVGLLDWFGEAPPTLSQIKGANIIETGAAHIKSITETGSVIIGSGYNVVGIAREIEKSDFISTWGYNVITKLAERYVTVNKSSKRDDVTSSLS